MISEKNQKLLEKFIKGCPESQGALSYENIVGFLYGIALCPESKNSNEWLDYLIGEEITFETHEEKNSLTDCLISMYKEFSLAFQNDTLVFPFDLEKMLTHNEELKPFTDWVTGFVDALYLRADFWNGENFLELAQEKRQILIHSMLMLEGIIEPEIVKEAFEKLPVQVLSKTYPTLDLQSDKILQQILMICIMASRDAVKTLQEHAKSSK